MDISNLLDDVRKHPKKYTYQQLADKYKVSYDLVRGKIVRAGLKDNIVPFKFIEKEEAPMAEPTKAQMEALLSECEQFGIDINDVKHFWHKSQRISMFVVAQNRPTYEIVRDELIVAMNKHSPDYPKVTYKPIKDKHLLVVDPADIHVGKLAVKSETGYSYDIQTAVGMAEEGVRGIVQKSQGFPIDRILLVVGNDVLHTDNPHRKTTGGTEQDTDGQWHQAFIAARKLYVRLIEELRQHAPVDVVFNPSNHDYVSGYMLTDALSCWFRKAKDVTFDATMEHRKYYQYGNSMIATTHGDGAKDVDMPLLMATEAPNIWAQTQYRYIYQHHIHHAKRIRWQSVKDYPGISLRTLRSPSAPDGWHNRKGYTGAPRAIEGFVHHIEFGEVARLSHLF